MRKLEENLKVGIFRPFAKVAAMKIGLGEVIVIKRDTLRAKFLTAQFVCTDQVMLQ